MHHEFNNFSQLQLLHHLAPRKGTKATETENKIQAAIEALNNDEDLNVEAAAREYNVSRHTLRRRVNGS